MSKGVIKPHKTGSHIIVGLAALRFVWAELWDGPGTLRRATVGSWPGRCPTGLLLGFGPRRTAG